MTLYEMMCGSFNNKIVTLKDKRDLIWSFTGKVINIVYNFGKFKFDMLPVDEDLNPIEGMPSRQLIIDEAYTDILRVIKDGCSTEEPTLSPTTTPTETPTEDPTDNQLGSKDNPLHVISKPAYVRPHAYIEGEDN